MGESMEEMPRAKRLKMLREAKERKEKIARGEIVDEAPQAEPSAAPDDDTNESVEQPASPKHSTVASEESAVAVAVQAQEDDGEEEGDVLNLAPKRANWDIERDIAPMLKKLERRTQHAIVEILREKMATEQQDADGSEDEGDDEDEEEEEEDEQQEASS
ncbi:hypothetical protein ATCC90586_004847 [Pythium insidiosum]|nr:hypothetical protein ATCC90586_004847 [Pythium insidiosum]